jgi:hypothetical protein
VAVVHAPPPARLFRCTGFSLFPCARIGPEAGPLGFVPPPVQPLDRTNAACRGNGTALSGGHGVRLRGHHDVGMATASVVHDWRARYPEFPEPVARLKAAHVWAWPDVEAWARKTGRIK